MHSIAQTQQILDRWMLATKSIPSMHHRRRWNMATSMVRLRNGHISKNPKRWTPEIKLGMQKKKKNVCECEDIYMYKVQKPHCWKFAMTYCQLWMTKTSLFFPFLISLPPSTLLIIPFFCLVCKPVLVFLVLCSHGLSLTFLAASKVFQFTEPCPLLPLSCMVFPRAQS